MPGAISVDDPCAATILADVSIIRPESYGIRQRGGFSDDGDCFAAGDCLGGHNSLVRRGATLELRDFDSRDAELAGVVISAGYIKLSSGLVKNNVVGVGIPAEAPDYPTLACVDRRPEVLFVDNDLPLSAAVLPVPSADLDLDFRDDPAPAADGDACRTVPFECDWRE